MILSFAVYLGRADPSLSDHDLSKPVTISPLFKTLQEIKQSLQDLSVAESYQQPHRGAEARCENLQSVSEMSMSLKS